MKNTKITIEIDAPENCEVESVHLGSTVVDGQGKFQGCYYVNFKTKIQARRIALEETGEERQVCQGEWYRDCYGNFCRWMNINPSIPDTKIWREVTEGE